MVVVVVPAVAVAGDVVEAGLSGARRVMHGSCARPSPEERLEQPHSPVLPGFQWPHGQPRMCVLREKPATRLHCSATSLSRRGRSGRARPREGGGRGRGMVAANRAELAATGRCPEPPPPNALKRNRRREPAAPRILGPLR